MEKINNAIQIKFKKCFELFNIVIFLVSIAYKTIWLFYLNLNLIMNEVNNLTFMLSLISGQLLADFVSGVVHWGCDTWGRVDIPILGPFIGSFREHHIDPLKMVRKPYHATNGNNCGLAFISICIMHYLEQIGQFQFVIGTYSFAIGVALTNQFHKWSHMPGSKLPAAVRILQKSGLILSFHHHHKHHIEHLSHYCITNGWMNEPLEKLNFWRNAEWIINKLTGAVPREDELEWFDQTDSIPIEKKTQ